MKSKLRTQGPLSSQGDASARGQFIGATDELLQDRSRTFGERRETTLLFADLRQFTELSAQLAHEAVYELLSQVMDCLTAQVIAHDGTVIDYFGDGLAAMWNAPTDQADHAERACRAALGMIESMPELGADWAGLLDGAKLRLGVGVHTGPVQVGNSGSQHVQKYGPRGAVVHTASRVETTTKKIGVPIVLTGATVDRLGDRLETYRVCRAQLPGIEQPVELFAVSSPQAGEPQCDAIAAYARALQEFEQGSLVQAARLLEALSPSDEPPTRFLLNYVQQQIGQLQGRRSGDRQGECAVGVVRFNAK